MATQTGTYDFAPVADAAGKASKYITDLGDDGIRVHPEDDTDNYAAIDADGMSVVRDAQSVAHFGEVTRIGKEGESKQELDYHSMRLVDSDGDTYFHVSDLRESDGTVPFEVTATGTGRGQTVRFPTVVDSSTITVTIDGVVMTSGWSALTGGSTAEGMYTYIAFTPPPASGAAIVCTARVTNADRARAMKAYTLGKRSGNLVGPYSFVTGEDNLAGGLRAQAHGHGTVAKYPNQTAIGRYNDGDESLAFTVGNGTSDSARSNAFEVGWDGNLWANNLRSAELSGWLGRGSTYVIRVGNLLIATGRLTECSLSTAYQWTDLAMFEPSAFGFTYLQQCGAFVDVNNNGPSWMGSVNGGGRMALESGTVHVQMQTNKAFTDANVKFIIMAFVY